MLWAWGTVVLLLSLLLPSKAQESPVAFSCGTSETQRVQQYKQSAPLCLGIVGVPSNAERVNRAAAFRPKVDEQDLLLVVDSATNLLSETGDIYVFIEAGGVRSELLPWRTDGLVVTSFSISVVVDEGKVKSLKWDQDMRRTCSKFSLLQNNCAVPEAQCRTQTNTSAEYDCDVQIYIVWQGSDKKGRFFTSAGQALSRLRYGSVGSMFEDVSKVVGDKYNDVRDSLQENLT
ncbi:MAG: hypothetical protein MHM6MM_000813 [Cercozoa sp. M6MM]